MKDLPSKRIDLGLALLSARRVVGARFTHRDIAAWCDCTPRWINLIEQRALKKLRLVVRRGEKSLSEELSETSPRRLREERFRGDVVVVNPEPAEITLKQWVTETAAREGVSCSAIYNRIHRHPERGPVIRRVNRRVLMVPAVSLERRAA